MGKEQNSNYYDSVYKIAESYKIDWQHSRYKNLWEAVIKLLNLNNPILDLGCGPGQFAKMCMDKGALDYFGIDFSQQAIDQAKSMNKGNKATFVVGDLFKIGYHLNDETQVVICETLEHIEKDLELITQIRNLNKGKRFVFTVPTFDDTSHVRYYKTAKEWEDRFSDVVKVAGWEQIGPWIIIHGWF